MAKRKEQPTARFENKLKNLSVGQIEQAVEKAISELVGDEYRVNINKIDFNLMIWGLVERVVVYT